MWRHIRRSRQGFILVWWVVAAWIYVGGMLTWMAADIYKRCLDCGVEAGSSSTATEVH